VSGGSSIRRNVIFKSTAFNTTEAKEYFINPCCFGDDLAKWLIGELRRRGVHTKPEPGQEDFGWYFNFSVHDRDYQFIIGYRPGEEDQPGDWMCTIEKAAGILGSLFGARHRGIEIEASQAIHSVLSSSHQISDIRWFTDEGYRQEQNGSPEPSPTTSV